MQSFIWVIQLLILRRNLLCTRIGSVNNGTNLATNFSNLIQNFTWLLQIWGLYKNFEICRITYSNDFVTCRLVTSLFGI